jgi:hypothetical protein
MTDKVDEKKVIKGKIRAFKRGSALDKQIGGLHYKNSKIDPIELIVAHKLDFIDGNIVKYAVRNKKGESLKEKYDKIIHYAELGKELLGE